MKRIVEDTNAEGLDVLLGERVTLFCMVYIYTGRLVGVNASYVKLEDAAIVYETGELNTKTWKDARPFRVCGISRPEPSRASAS